MAKTSMKMKQQAKPKFSTRAYTRCRICGRPHSVLKKYGICRICFRELAYKGQIMLTRIRNANTAKHDTVDIPSSKMKIAIANILLDEGYIRKYEMVDNGNFQDIRITLKYGADKNDKIITGLKRISKPGLRVYAKKNEVPKVLDGLGTAILSTNQGVITDKKARELEVGGEVLAFIW